MAFVKKVDNTYLTTVDVGKLLNYILNPEKMEHNVWGCGGVYMNNNIYDVAKQIVSVNMYYGKIQGNLVHHFVISYPYLEGQCTPQRMEYALEQVLSIDLCGFPYIYALHENTMHKHFHLVIGSVNIYTGNKYVDKNSTLLEISRTLSAYSTYKDRFGRKYHISYDVIH